MTWGLVEVGTVEILWARVYAIDPQAASGAATTAVVDPGEFPLYKLGAAHLWIMEGTLNLGDIQKVDDGMFVFAGHDIPSSVTLRFPSRAYAPREWKELLAEPVTQEGHQEQRLRVKIKEPT